MANVFPESNYAPIVLAPSFISVIERIENGEYVTNELSFFLVSIYSVWNSCS